MRATTQIPARTYGLPPGASERLAQFAKWTGTTPPLRTLDDKGFTDAFLVYAEAEGLSLDWFIHGDVRGLVMAVHYAVKDGCE